MKLLTMAFGVGFSSMGIFFSEASPPVQNSNDILPSPVFEPLTRSPQEKGEDGKRNNLENEQKKQLLKKNLPKRTEGRRSRTGRGVR